VKGVLVEIGQILGGFKGKFAVIGGAVPWLLLDNEDMPHVGTLDVDSGLIGSKESGMGFPLACWHASLSHAQNITFTVSPGDRQRLRAIVADPKSPQKHVWRARIVLLSSEGLGTSAIMAATGKAKTCVWRWQERFMHEGVDGLLHRPVPPARKGAGPARACRRDHPADAGAATA
jgi:hypothetical protein